MVIRWLLLLPAKLTEPGIAQASGLSSARDFLDMGWLRWGDPCSTWAAPFQGLGGGVSDHLKTRSGVECPPLAEDTK